MDYKRVTMKKNILLTFILFLSVIAAAAHERPLSEKQKRALAVMAARNPKTTVQDSQLQVVMEDDFLTVMTDGSQFAIIANDDNFPAVVGYADGAFSTENNSLTWFLNAAKESMAQQLANGTPLRTAIAPDASKFQTSIQPLLNTTWNQGEPYNNMCPKASNGKAYPSGCVATALSQIMKYHAFPTHGIGEKQYSFQPSEGSGELLYANFGATTYDWDNMLNNYTSGGYTEEQGNAVATIMLHCGVAVEMNYTPTGSGAYSSEACNGLVQFFGYNENVGIVYRNYYSLEQWMNMVFTELNMSRPVYYAGSDSSRGGHAFVIDGYDEDGLVHVNWGWGPDGGNGYYDISLLNPTGYQFSNSQNMLIGIDLPTADIKYESHLVSDYALSVSKTGKLLNVKVGQSIWNLNGGAWEGDLAVILEGEGQTYELSRGTVCQTANLHDVLANISKSINGMLKLPTDIADGTYRLYVGAKSSRDERWQLVRRGELANSYLIEVSSGSVSTVTSDTDDQWVPTYVRNISTTKPAGNTAVYDLQGRRISEASTSSLQKGIYVKDGKKFIAK